MIAKTLKESAYGAPQHLKPVNITKDKFEIHFRCWSLTPPLKGRLFSFDLLRQGISGMFLLSTLPPPSAIVHIS